MTETKRQAPRDYFDLTPEEKEELTRRMEDKRAAKFQKFLSDHGYNVKKCKFEPKEFKPE